MKHVARRRALGWLAASACLWCTTALPAAEKLCVVDDVVLAEGSIIRSGGSGSVVVDVGNEGTIHDGGSQGLLYRDAKAPVVYHPYKELRFYCEPVRGRLGELDGCDPRVRQFEHIDYQTEEYEQPGLYGPWYHPPMTVKRNGSPEIMPDDKGVLYQNAYRAPKMSRQYAEEPLTFNSLPARSALLSTASRIENMVRVSASLSFGPFAAEIPLLPWENADVINSVGAKINCKIAELAPEENWLCSECIGLDGQQRDGAPVWSNGGECESDWEMRDSDGNACAAGDANCFYYCPDPPEGVTSSSRCPALHGLGDCGGGGVGP